MIQTSKSHILIPDPVTSLPGIYLIKMLKLCRKLLFRRLFIVASLLMAKIGNTLNVTFRDSVRHICYILRQYVFMGGKKRNIWLLLRNNDQEYYSKNQGVEQCEKFNFL